MARVLLIRPPLSQRELFAPGTETSGTLTAPLGLAYLASYLRKHGHDCSIADGLVEPWTLESIADHAKQFDMVGVTAFSTYALRAFELIGAIKKASPDLCVVAGGPHATVLPETFLNCRADYVVVGEGEVTLYELVESVCGDRRPAASVAGIMYVENGEYRWTGPRSPIDPLDDVPLPARDLLPMALYRDSVLRAAFRPSHALTTSRGCPGKCSFCNKKMFGTQVRHFSVDRVVEEFFLLRDAYGARHVAVYDDTFTANRDVILDVCDRLSSRNFSTSWSAFTRVDAVDETLLSAMKGAGCTQVEFGIESGSERMLKHMNKRQSKEDVRTAVRIAKRVGLTHRGFFMMGFPTETREEMLETAAFARELDLDYVSFTLFTPLPGTVEYQRALRNGHFRDPEYYLHEIVPQFEFAENPLYVPDGMTAAQLIKMQRNAYRRYYFAPRRVLRALASVRSAEKLGAMTRGALSLLGIHK